MDRQDAQDGRHEKVTPQPDVWGGREWGAGEGSVGLVIPIRIRTNARIAKQIPRPANRCAAFQEGKRFVWTFAL